MIKSVIVILVAAGAIGLLAGFMMYWRMRIQIQQKAKNFREKVREDEW